MIVKTRRAHSVHVWERMACKGVILPHADHSKDRYQEKLKLLNGRDPYKLPREAWKDNVDLWLCTTYIHVGMYFVFSPRAYTGEALMNAGWVREILVSAQGETRVLTSKVCHH